MNELLADFVHGEPFELVRAGRVAFDAQQRAAPELFGPLSGDVNEKEPAGDERRRIVRRRVLFRICAVCVVVFDHGA